jgi:hypothetical protein
MDEKNLDTTMSCPGCKGIFQLSQIKNTTPKMLEGNGSTEGPRVIVLFCPLCSAVLGAVNLEPVTKASSE